MKVFQIGIGVEVPRGEGRRQVHPVLGHCGKTDARYLLDELNGRPFSRKWRPLRFYLDKPKLERPDFYVIPGGWVCNERAMELAGEAMEMAGEYLPVGIEGEAGQFMLYHVTNCVNVLDADRSEWKSLGEFRELWRPVFRPERFGEESLFKIPENYGTRAYCLERSGDADEGEFKAVVQRHGLKGLSFELVWSDAG